MIWASEHNVHEQVLAYVASDPAIFDSPRSNPRAWTYVSDLMHAAGDGSERAATLTVAIAGCVGPERAAAFTGYLKARLKPLTADQVLGAYSAHRSTLSAWTASGQLDLVKATLRNILKMLQAADGYSAVRSDQRAWQHFGAFLADLPGDLRDEARQFLRERNYDVPKGGKK